MSEVKSEYLRITIHFSGKYIPNKFFEDYNFPYKIIHEINTIARTGRDKGKLSKDSFCYFVIGEGDGLKHNEKIKTAVELALKIKKDAKLKKVETEYFKFHLFFTGIQGNMELSKEELKWLNKLNEGICMNYIFEEID